MDLSGANQKYLVVSFTVQNLVTIDIIVSKIRMAGKRLFTPPKFGFGGYFTH